MVEAGSEQFVDHHPKYRADMQRRCFHEEEVVVFKASRFVFLKHLADREQVAHRIAGFKRRGRERQKAHGGRGVVHHPFLEGDVGDTPAVHLVEDQVVAAVQATQGKRGLPHRSALPNIRLK